MNPRDFMSMEVVQGQEFFRPQAAALKLFASQ